MFLASDHYEICKKKWILNKNILAAQNFFLNGILPTFSPGWL